MYLLGAAIYGSTDQGVAEGIGIDLEPDQIIQSIHAGELMRIMLDAMIKLRALGIEPNHKNRLKAH